MWTNYIHVEKKINYVQPIATSIFFFSSLTTFLVLDNHMADIIVINYITRFYEVLDT